MPKKIQLIENRPLNTNMMEALLFDKDDLYLVWPVATWPFNHEQWCKALDPNEGHKSYFVYSAETLIVACPSQMLPVVMIDFTNNWSKTNETKTL